MTIKLYKLSGYRLITPKYQKMKVASDNTFDIEILEYWIHAIKKLKVKAKMYSFSTANTNGKKTMYLDKVISDTDEYIFGFFKTGIYGTIQEFYNRFNNSKTYEKSKNETSDAVVYFYLYKKTGVFLVGYDPNHAINISSLKRYFTRFEFLLEPFRDKFNELNDKGQQIYRNRMIRVLSLPPIEFFEEIKNMEKIKEASFVVNRDGVSDTFDIIKELKELDENKGLKSKDVEIEISLKNISGKKLVKDIERLFTILNKDETFDDLKVKGKYNTGKMKTIRNNMPIRTFEINVDYGNMIYPINHVEVKQKLHDLNMTEMILFGNVFNNTDIEFLSEVEDLYNEISKKARSYNKRFYNLKPYRGKLFRKNK